MNKKFDDTLREEYTFDYSKGVKGKYYSHNIEENGYVKLLPDVQKYFKTSEEVNKILLSVMNAINNSQSQDNLNPR
jgi:hypothetical protein